MKTITGFEDYKIDENGNIWSFKSGKTRYNKLLKPLIDPNGYARTTLYNIKGQFKFLVHRLVYMMYGEFPLDTNLTINHEDGNKMNNNISNLKQMTSADNTSHSFDTGLTNHPSETHYNAILSNIQVEEIRNNYMGKWGEQKILAEKYNVSQGTISDIVNGRTRKRNIDGSKNTKIIIKRGVPTESQRLEMIKLVKEGKSLAEVGRLYNVTRQAIWWLVHKKDK